MKDVLKKLKGVKKVALLDSALFSKILSIEKDVELKSHPKVVNLGVSEVLKNEEVFVVLKDTTFQKPPSPTVYLVEERNPKSKDTEVLRIDGRVFRILGHEVVDGKKEFDEEVAWMNDSFVTFPLRRVDPPLPMFYLLPPTTLTDVKDSVCCSPSKEVDDFLRKELGFDTSEEFGTLMVYFR